MSFETGIHPKPVGCQPDAECCFPNSQLKRYRCSLSRIRAQRVGQHVGPLSPDAGQKPSHSAFRTTYLFGNFLLVITVQPQLHELPCFVAQRVEHLLHLVGKCDNLVRSGRRVRQPGRDGISRLARVIMLSRFATNTTPLTIMESGVLTDLG